MAGELERDWGSLSVDSDRKYRRAIGYPLLLVPTEDNSEQKRGLYDMPAATRRLGLQVDVSYNKRCCGSSQGWLGFVEPDLAIILLNPFTGASIKLPPIYEWTPDPLQESSDAYQVMKFILSADPTTHENFQIMAIVWSDDQYVASLNSGDESWAYSDRNLPVLFDLIYYKGLIYTSSYAGGVFSFRFQDIGDKWERKTVVPADEGLISPFIKTYLAESTGGDLLLIARFTTTNRDDEQHWTVRFRVYKIKLMSEDEEEMRGERLEVETLEGDVLFLGDSHSMCVKAADFPQCRPNSIYFTDDCCNNLFYGCPLGAADNGCFSLEDNKVSRPYAWDAAHKDMPPPIWILPTPQPPNIAD